MRFSRKGISLCANCPLNDRPRVWGEGDENGKLIIIGEAPGRNEEFEKRPFVGGAGKELTRGLVQAGIFRRNIWITNVISCRPPSNDIDSDDAREAIHCCRPGFEAELAYLKSARVLVPVGNTALAALGVSGRITKLRGSVFEIGKNRLEKVGRFAVPTFHPAYILRDRKNHSVWIADLKKAKEISKDGWKPPTENFNLFPTVEDVEQFLEDLRGDTLVGFDSETTSLDPRYGRIVVMGFAKRGGNVLSVPLLRAGDHEYWPAVAQQEVCSLVRRILESSDLVFHNAAFDVSFLEAWGFPVPRIHEDTMLLHHAIHPELSHKLGFVVSIYGETPYWKDGFLGREVGILELSDEDVRTYNARDAAVLLEILPGLIADAQELGVYEHVYRDISLGLIRPTLAMSQRGILLSESRRRTWQGTLDHTLASLDQSLKERAATPEGFNLDSDTDLRLLIYGWKASKFEKAEKELLTYADAKRRKDTKHYRETLQKATLSQKTEKLYGLSIKPTQRTSSGMPSVDKESLLLAALHLRNRLSQIDRFTQKNRFVDEQRRIKDGISWLSDLRTYVKTGKLRSTYTTFPTDTKGFVHTHYLVHGTNTGRLASRDPNLQNQPLEARKLFIARPGYALVGRDYVNLELRIAGILSQDRAMLEAFERGDNLHDLNTTELFGLSPPSAPGDRTWNAARRAAKIYIFGRRLYGGSSKGIYLEVLAEVPELELTYAQFQKFDQIFDGMYPGLAKWQRHIKAEVLGTRMVRNAFGRLRIFLGQTHDIEREGLNFPVQSSAADLINMATITIHRRLSKTTSALVLQIHDELVAEAPKASAADVDQIMREEMESPVRIDNKDWSFPTEGKIGKDWSQLK